MFQGAKVQYFPKMGATVAKNGRYRPGDKMGATGNSGKMF